MAGTFAMYLAWPPLGLEPLERFAASYRAHPAGIEHRLVVVVKGPADDRFTARCHEIVAELGGQSLAVPAVGIDLDTYRRVGTGLDADTLCLLNSSSAVLGDGWLAALHGVVTRPGVGLAGCTGTYESSLSAAPRPLRPFLRRRYPAFPNPHIRTNAVMLRRELMLELEWPETVGTKRRALELESGVHGITRQVQARGLSTLVVGRDGRAYPPEEWPQSRTFRAGDQDNLLVADNRTRQYDQASAPFRAQLAGYAWGDRAPVSPAQLAEVPPA